jgi:hypothetical protein
VKERKKELDKKKLLCVLEIISFQQDVHGNMY